MYFILITTMILFMKMNSYINKSRHIVVPIATKNIYEDENYLDSNLKLEIYTFYKQPYRTGFKKDKKEALTNENVKNMKNIKNIKKEKKLELYNCKKIRKKERFK